jgi:hypothetical protein
MIALWPLRALPKVDNADFLGKAHHRPQLVRRISLLVLSTMT